VAALCFIPLVLLFAPESISFLMEQRRSDTLARINRLLARMGHRAVDALPDPAPKALRVRLAALFTPAFVSVTVALTAAYLAHIMTFYFILKWIPKIVVDMGFAPPLAAGVLVWASIGGASGSLLLGLLTTRLRVYTLTMVAMLASTLAIVAFGRGQSDLTSLSLIAAIAGFATNAGVVGLYALVAAAFPTHLRATATGFVIGVGRGGSALAPALAGLLFKAGYGLATVAILMALGSLIAAFALFTIRARLRTAA
jgi:predicted MFS family arabinose efflux permease